MANKIIQDKANFYADSIIKVPKTDIELVHKKQLIEAYLTGAAQQKAELLTPEIKELLVNTKGEFDALERIHAHEDYPNKHKDEWDMTTTIVFNLMQIYEKMTPLFF